MKSTRVLVVGAGLAAAYSLDPGVEIRAAAAAPAGPIAFAGEHLAAEYGGLMEGAIRSGMAAASRVPLA